MATVQPPIRARRASLVLPIAAALAGCSDGDVQDDFEDFVVDVRSAAGPDSRACGTSAIEDEVRAATVCVAQAFGANEPAWSVQTLPGLGSFRADGLAVSGEGRVTRHAFDGDPFGNGSVVAPDVDVTVCENAALSGTVDVGLLAAFTCDD